MPQRIVTPLTDDNVKDAYPAIADDGTIAWRRFIGPPDQSGWITGEIMVRSPSGQVTRLTDNDQDDWEPVINRWGSLAWTRAVGVGCGGRLMDIYHYDGQRIVPITTDAVSEGVANQVPQLNDNNQIVFVRFDFCAQPDWASEIRMYDSGDITTLTDGQVRPNSPDINLPGLVGWFHRRPPNGANEIQLWRDGEITVLTEWGTGVKLNDAGSVAFHRWHEDTQLWQQWLFYSGAFWQLSDDPFWNRNGRLNQRGDVVWLSGPTFTSNIRYMRRFSIADVNCDRSIDAFDIEPFLLALFDPDGYRQAHPTCDALLADIDQNGRVDAFDIEPFIDLLFP